MVPFDERASRWLMFGPYALFEWTGEATTPLAGITVAGRANGSGFKRDLSYLVPFDPTGAVKSVSFGLNDLLPLARAMGEPLAQAFPGEGPELDTFVPVLPNDPAAEGDVVLSMPSETGRAIALIRGGKKATLKIIGVTSDLAMPLAAVELPGGDIAVLALNADGSGAVEKISGTSVADLQTLPVAPADLVSPTPDTLAVGPQGQLAILRTPGSDPPSADDPALLFVLGAAAPIALAPWSTLTAADDPACKADANGWRAIVRTSTPWLRLRGAPNVPESDRAGAMFARVKWSAQRLCLESVELPESQRTMMPRGDLMETEIIARFVGAPVASRVAMIAGAELHQPLTCTLP
jgi:hypothetical protein